MRQATVLVVLLGLFAGLGAMAAMRLLDFELPRAVADPAEVSEADGVDAAVEAGERDATPPRPDPEAAIDGAVAAADADAPRSRETLRVIGMGWDLLVPGVLANGGVTPSDDGAFGEAGLDVHLRSVSSMERVEAALAHGGDAANGAHIAIVPLPTFVASYERLRALAPEVFFVVAWSQGRDAVYAAGADDLRRPPRRNVTVFGSAGAPQTLTALFLLRHAGVHGDQVRLVDGARGALFAAVDRSGGGEPTGSQGRRALATTADASQLAPYVALAPAGFLESDADSVAAWTRAWLSGVEQMQADVPLAARTVAALDNAPEPMALLRRVGQMRFADLAANTRVLGLSGRGAITLEALFQETWSLWRDVGALTTPAPDAVPMSTGPIISVVLGSATQPMSARVGGDPSFDTDPILERRLRVDEAELIAELGLLAGVFERSAIEVAFRGSRTRAERVIAQACDRFDLPRARFRPLREEGRGARIVLHAAP